MRRAIVTAFFITLSLGTASLFPLLTVAMGASCGKDTASLLLCVSLSATRVGVLLLALVALWCAASQSFRQWLQSMLWDNATADGLALIVSTALLTGLTVGLTRAITLACTSQPSFGCSSDRAGIWVIIGLSTLSGIRLLIWYAHQATRRLSGEPLNPNDRRPL